MILKFEQGELGKLWKQKADSTGEENGQVTIIGGSELFTGAPLFALIAASRLVDMVFLATPESDKGAFEKTVLFSQLKSVVWIPKDDIDRYVEKSDAILIGPGMMRFNSESRKDEELKSISQDHVFDEAGTETKSITKYLLQKFPNKRWVIDGGSLQVMDTGWIPKGAILTPNIKEYQILFNDRFTIEGLEANAKKSKCIIVHKGPVGYVTDGETTYEIDGGNAGLTKGGTGDTLAGMTAGLLAKNPALLAAACASFVIKKTAEKLAEKVGENFNADDVAENAFSVMKALSI